MLVFDFSVTPAKLSLLRPGGEADKIKNTAANVLLLGRMLPYPWCHLNYRQSLPVTLCALPVESTAAITSGARLPLLLHTTGSGSGSRVFFGSRFLRGFQHPALSVRKGRNLTFPGQRFYCLHCITGFCLCQHSMRIFLQTVILLRTLPRSARNDGTASTAR